MNTAIIGRFKGCWYVFSEWETMALLNRENQVKVVREVRKVSGDHPDVPIFHYIVAKKKLSRGGTFKYTEWDNIVVSSQVHYNENPQEWDNVNYYDVMQASKQARQELGL